MRRGQEAELRIGAMRYALCDASESEATMATEPKAKGRELSPEESRRRESGEPGGGAGRTDEVTRHGIFPYSAPHPDDVENELMTPATLIHAPYDESGHSESNPLEDVPDEREEKPKKKSE